MDQREREAARSIAAEVRRARRERGWSQLELAERADLSLNYVSLIERAERLPSLEVLLQLAGALGTTLPGLVGGPPEDRDPWLGEAIGILRALPDDARPLMLGMLRGALATAPKAGRAAVRTRRARSRK